MNEARETKSVKVFLFAPENAQLRNLLSSYVNVRRAVYVTAKDVVPYMRVRVRKKSNTVVGIARQFAQSFGPIVKYGVGTGQGRKKVATIRVEKEGCFDEIVKIASQVCKEVTEEAHKAHVADATKPEVHLTCRVSDIVARDETPWVEIFAVQKHQPPVEVWMAAVEKLSTAVGAKAQFHDAKIEEF